MFYIHANCSYKENVCTIDIIIVYVVNNVEAYINKEIGFGY